MSTRERQPDTRTRIQQVALDLFAEHGYEKTALREIAERLGVTKAALYYHFKTKEDIVASIFADGGRAIDDLVEWAHTQPASIETRREIVRRYAGMMKGQRKIMRFFQENQPAIRDLKMGESMKSRMSKLFTLLTVPDASLADQLRARLSLFSITTSMFVLNDVDASDADRDAAAIEVALDLVR